MKFDKAYVEKVDESIGELQMVLRDLKDLVAADGKVTDEEKGLLSSIADNLERYYTLLEDVVEDEVITDDEFAMMKTYETELLKGAQSKALEDGHISADEREMLNLLAKTVKEIGTLNY